MPRRSANRRRRTNRNIGHEMDVWSFIRQSWLNVLLILIPISLAFEWLGLSKVLVFTTSALAIIPLANLIGQATSELSNRVGPGIGGLLNATFGNAAELIINLFALKAGLHTVVKASISGSIIGNILLVLGIGMFAGGIGREKQKFNRTSAGASAAMLFLAVVALVMPALFDLVVFGSLRYRSVEIEELSLLVSAVLILTYVASLIFSLKTHRDLLKPEPAQSEAPTITTTTAVSILLVAAALTALESELLVGAITDATKALGISQFFVGVVVIAIVGNAAEHYTAVTAAIKDRMDLSVTIATASSTQIALFVAPVLVFASLILGPHLSLVFNAFEVVGVALSVIALSLVSLDGESNWFEGLQLVAVYLVLAIVFFFVPS